MNKDDKNIYIEETVTTHNVTKEVKMINDIEVKNNLKFKDRICHKVEKKDVEKNIDIRTSEMNSSDEDYIKSREIINEIIVDLFKNIMMIEEKAVKMRGISDLSMSEIHAIDAIGVGSGKMMSEVADILNITMGTLTSTMTKLEKKGYAKREKDPKDRRVVIASLTKYGELAFKIHKNFHDEMVDRVILDLDLHEDKVLIKSLKNINDFFIREYLKK